MAGGKLEVQIGADKTDFDKKIKEVEFDIKELSKVKLEQLKVGLDTTQINAQIKDAKASLNSLKTTVKDTGASFTGMAPKVANGGNALMQFSRIAQDAPYGIIGIGNNLTATAEAFSYLKQSTGSTGGALKALASSLAGTGGILLGVSLLTTGLTLLSQSGLSVGDVIDKITGKYNEFGAELKKVNEEAIKSASQEINLMNTLVSVAQNETRTKEDRLNAVKQLKSEFPEYYKQLSSEKIMYGDLTSVTKEATKALLTRAVAEKLANKNADVFEQKLLAQGRYNKKRDELNKYDIDSEKRLEKAREYLKNNASITQIELFEDLKRKEEAGRTNILQGIKEESNSIGQLTKRYENLLNVIDDIYEPKVDKETKKTKKSFVTPQVQALLPMVSAPVVDVNTIAVFNGQIDALGGKVKELPGVIKAGMDGLVKNVKAPLTEIEKAIIDFNARAGEIISSALVDTFAGIGAAIGNALASGGNVLQAIGGSLLSSLGGLLTDMGKMAIQVGVGLLAIKTALKSLNPAVAIGAGVALIALGSFFSSKSSSIGGSVGGGGKGASSNSGSGANNQSFTSSGFSGGGNNGGTVVFEIAGQKLIGVLSNTLNANRRLGGQLGL
jgi:hypothetical protein